MSELKAYTIGGAKDTLITSIIVDAIIAISDFQSKSIQTDNIKIEEKIGDPSETQLVRGIVIDKTIDNSAMPRAMNRCKNTSN